MKHLLTPAGLALGLASCTTSDQTFAPKIPGPAASVTRSEAISIVEAYAKTCWIAEKRHSFHGEDRDKIKVSTPDAHKGGGFWKVDHINFGMPYKWGGFDTPRSFKTGLQRGRFAGDISSPHKRKNLRAAVSKEAVGIDCSGLISRAWRLKRPHSTRDLPNICTKLESWDELQPGDVLNLFNGHVVMFAGWKDRGQYMYGYEAGPYSGWRVSESVLRISYLKNQGYVPLRYRNIRKDGELRKPADPPLTIPALAESPPFRPAPPEEPVQPAKIADPAKSLTPEKPAAAAPPSEADPLPPAQIIMRSKLKRKSMSRRLKRTP